MIADSKKADQRQFMKNSVATAAAVAATTFTFGALLPVNVYGSPRQLSALSRKR